MKHLGEFRTHRGTTSLPTEFVVPRSRRYPSLNLAAAQANLSAAIDGATCCAGRPHHGGIATVDPEPVHALTTARDRHEQAKINRRDIPTHLPLHQVRPSARVLNEETKLVTHAIRMSAYNAESALARLLAGRYARADDEARALIREASTLSGDLHVTDQCLASGIVSQLSGLIGPHGLDLADLKECS